MTGFDVTTIASIVEGHGEVSALPALLRRLSAWIAPLSVVDINPPIRTNKSKFLNDDDEFCAKVQLASLKAAADGWVLIILDADDDCPVQLATQISQKARACGIKSKLSVVIANREFESWFLASCISLNGVRGFNCEGPDIPDDPEVKRDAKGWMARRMPAGYHEVGDQPAFAACMSLETAWTRSRSFRRLVSEFIANTPNYA